MTPLGKCLVFYFKYQPEMVRLYWKENIDELENPEETLKMVNAIGDKCCEEVGDFLTASRNIILKHFSAIGKCQLDKLSTTKWTGSCGIWPQGATKPHTNNWKMMAGVDIPRTGGEIVAWLWGKGKMDAEERMVAQFGDMVKARSSELGLEAGTVALARIPALPEKVDGFEVDRDELLKQVEQAFVSISQLNFENVYNFIKGLS